VKYFNFIVSLILVVIYALGKIPPSESYNLWLTTFIIPFALVANLILLMIAAAMKKKSGIYYIIALVFGSNYLMSTFGVRRFFSSTEPSSKSFSILSYNINARLDDVEMPADEKDPNSKITLEEWIMGQEADIQCYQEFLDNRRKSGFDLINKLKARGYHSFFSFDSLNSNRIGSVVGTLITSRYPIVKFGDVFASENGFNRISYADLVIGADTLRVINVHLESMGLKPYHPANATGFESGKDNTRMLFAKLKDGVFERSEQIKILAAFVETSPYPAICAGDFNELPYSYSYQFLKKRMKNAFEQVGTGFGFTYNGNTLRVLRIDNQFYSTGIEAVSFETRREVIFTDHFPLVGEYQLQP
jgi:endonuclease/exonuclease/phosphatase family metal-dependent hydrolase